MHEPLSLATNPDAPIYYIAPDIAGDTTTTAVITVGGGSLQGTFEQSLDQDWYRIELTAGQVVMGSVSANQGPTYCEFRSSDGTPLANQTFASSGLTSTSVFVAPTSGTFYFAALSLLGTTGSAQYNAYVATYEPPDSDITRAQLGGGTSALGTLPVSTDHDWYRAYFIRNHTYAIRVSADNGSSLDTYLRLHRNGVVVAENNDDPRSTNSALNFLCSQTGFYYIDVSGAGRAATGDYAVRFTDLTPPLPVWSDTQIAERLAHGYWQDKGYATAPTWFLGGNRTVTVSLGALQPGSPTQQALAAIADVADIHFIESASPQIEFLLGGPSSTTLTLSGPFIAHAVVFYSPADGHLLHAIGKALGLGEAGHYENGLAVAGLAEPEADSIFVNDSMGITMMSAFDTSVDWFAERHFAIRHTLTPMPADILALQMLYGAAAGTRAGDTVYGVGTNADPAIYGPGAAAGGVCVYDTGGTDTLDLSTGVVDQVIDLNPGVFMDVLGSYGSYIIATGTVIENAVGGQADDRINGNEVANALTGNAGNDSLFGNDGNDILEGKAGNDALAGGNGADVLRGGNDNDELLGGADRDVLLGENGADVLTGGGGADRLFGGTGQDTLRGGSEGDLLSGGLGADALTGGTGLDVFLFDAKLGSGNIDAITDFTSGDLFRLDRAIFSALSTEAKLTTAEFFLGTAAHDASDRIVYDSATGRVFYDPDGTGAAAAVLFATVTPGTALVAGQFQLTGMAPPVAAPLLQAASLANDTWHDALGW